MAIIITVLAIAVPFFSNAIIRAKESVLQSNLFTIRSVIDQYTYDKEEPPQGLQDLVDEGYLRDIPVDPNCAVTFKLRLQSPRWTAPRTWQSAT